MMSKRCEVSWCKKKAYSVKAGIKVCKRHKELSEEKLKELIKW